MRNQRFLAALLALIACESDETKLERLKVAQAQACLPVIRADSEERSYAALLRRIKAIENGTAVYGPGSLAQARADAEEAHRRVLKLDAATNESTSNPVKYAEKKQDEENQRIRCELATRKYEAVGR